MNYKLTLYPYKEALQYISKDILALGSTSLEKSRKIEKYGISPREIFGLSIVCYLRNELEPAQWFFATSQELSDDGTVFSGDTGYYENIEQIYLPGKFIERQPGETVNDFIIRQIKSRKSVKGLDYSRDKCLFVLSDFQSKDTQDCFEWNDFRNKFFKDKTFLHIYFVSLINRTPSYNKYYLFSFTNQKHRQKLNGEFYFNLGPNGIFDFKCFQKINLLNHEKKGILKVPKKREDKIL